MRVHIWCPRVSDSAIAIRDSLRQKGIIAYKSRAEQTPRRARLFNQRVRPGDVWVNWGAPIVPLNIGDGPIVLNATRFLNKRDQLIRLEQAGVPCLEVSNHPQEGWIGRSFNHQGGHDLITNTGRDYWTKKLNFSRELRIHIYKGKSVHAGLKVPRPGVEPHPWIRSYDTGWKIDYSYAKDLAASRRDLAKRAVEALELDFGAVDIGVIRGDSAVVLEVNTAPGLDTPSVEAYVQQLLKETF